MFSSHHTLSTTEFCIEIKFQCMSSFEITIGMKKGSKINKEHDENYYIHVNTKYSVSTNRVSTTVRIVMNDPIIGTSTF